jgi:hypothetical protein
MNKEVDENSRIPGYLNDLPKALQALPSDLASPDILELNEKGISKQRRKNADFL